MQLGMPIFIAVALALQVTIAVAATIVIGTAILVGVVVLGLLLRPKAPTTNADLKALQQSLNPDAYRVIVLGRAPCGNDVRYWEIYGSSGYDQIIAAATHKLTSFQEFYANGRQITFAGANSSGAATGIAAISTVGQPDYGAPTSQYSGALTKTNVLEGVTATTVSGTTGAGGLWTSAASMTHCAFYRLKWNYSQAALPTGVPSNDVCIAEGAPIYDPRKDTTVGGSGSHRANDNTTWAYSTLDSNGVPIGRNNALQMLWYLLGWSVPNTQTGKIVLLAGRGVDPNDIDYAQFIAAANECETAGFYTDCTLSTGDDHNTNEGVISSGSTIGVLIDSGGLWGYYPSIDDTATIACTLDDNSIVGGVQWVPKTGISQSFNSVSGHFVDPSTVSVYQPAPYPAVVDATYLSQDGQDRRTTLDFQNIQDPALAQKVARIALNKGRLTGQFSATYNMSAMQAQCYSCVTQSFKPFGWVNKLFRVTGFSINPQGGCDLTLQEEASSVYTGGTVNTLTPRVGTQVYDPTQNIPLVGLTVSASFSSNGAGSNAVVTDVLIVSWTAPGVLVKSVELQYRITGTTNWIPHAGLIGPDTTTVIIPGLIPAAAYDVQARTWSINGIPSAWATPTPTSTTVGSLTTYTQNQWFNQGTDPSLAVTVNDGATWINSATSKTYKRISGSWVLQAIITAMVDGDLLFDSSAPGTYNVPIPSNALTKIDGFVYGGGGGGGAAHGGGGSGFSYIHNSAVTAGTTVLVVVIGAAGVGFLSGIRAAGDGGSSSLTNGATVLHGFGGGNGATAAGALGAASGGGTNVSGEAGDSGATGNGGANLGTVQLGLGVAGGARKTTAGVGNGPGGGGHAGASSNSGSVGRVIIYTRT